MGYSIDPISDNCYPGITVLINKLDIRDEETLNEAETLATYDINWSEVEGDLLMISTIQAANGVTDLLKNVLDGTKTSISVF